MNSSFFVGAGFGVVGIACLFMVFVWSAVAVEKRVPRERRYHAIAWTLAVASGCLAGLCFNRALEEVWGSGFAPLALYILLGGMGAANVVLMSSSAIDGDRRLAGWFLIASMFWIVICAWKVLL